MAYTILTDAYMLPEKMQEGGEFPRPKDFNPETLIEALDIYKAQNPFYKKGFKGDFNKFADTLRKKGLDVSHINYITDLIRRASQEKKETPLFKNLPNYFNKEYPVYPNKSPNYLNRDNSQYKLIPLDD